MITIAGIVIPGLLAVLALHRWIAPVPWRIVALFFALTLAFLHGAVFTSKLPVPVDEIARGYPWHGLFPDVTEARNGLTNDTVKLFLPWMQVAREELSHGRAPLWNRYSFSGYPLLANSESAPFSPLFLATLFVPLPKQIVAMAGLKLFFALLFTFLVARREGLSDAAAIFAACVYAFCTFQTVYLYYSTTAVTALLPFALFALLRAVDDRGAASIALIAIAIFTLLANGHPESVLHIAICAVVLLALEARLSFRRWSGPLAGVASGLFVAAPVWIPVLQQVFLSARLQELHHATPQVLPFSTAWSLIAPDHFGNPLHHDWHGPLNYSVFASSYCGLLPLGLAIYALFAPRTPGRDRGLLVFAVLSIIIAMNWTILGHALNAVPPFSVTANDKLRFVAVFLIAIASARVLKRFAWIAIAIVIADLFFYNAGFNALVDAKYFRPRLTVIDALHAHAPPDPFRVVGRDWIFLPNASAQYGVEDIRGSDPMEPASYATFFKTFSTQEPGTDVKRVQDADRPELDFLNVRFLLAEPDAQLGGKWRTIYRGADGALFENASAERRFFSSTVKIGAIENRDPRKFRMRVSGAGTVMSSEPATPGWTLFIDGRRAALSSETFISFHVPNGEHDVRLIYRPMAFYASLVASMFGVAMLIAYGVFGTRT